MAASAIYEGMAATLLGRSVPRELRDAALAAPLRAWNRALAIEGCALPLGRILARRAALSDVPLVVHGLLRQAASQALTGSLALHTQLPPVVALARRDGIRVIALKGAARLISGMAAERVIADIDLLVAEDAAEHLAGRMRAELGYARKGGPQPHHLAPLALRGGLTVELHTRLGHERSWLDGWLRSHTRTLALHGIPVEVPSPTALALHTLDHASALNWAFRYRLRDVLDTASACGPEVDIEVIRAWAARSAERDAIETLLAAAAELAPRLRPFHPTRERTAAWQRIRRVGRARARAAAIPNGTLTAQRAMRYAGVLAEGSPRLIVRLTASSVLRAAGMASSRLRGLLRRVATARPGERARAA